MGSEYTSNAIQEFLKSWGVKHRLSSAYNPQSNGRAEVTVKTMKHLLSNNVGTDGSLNSDTVTRAMLQLRNTPEGDSGVSPTQILFGRTLRDTLPHLQFQEIQQFLMILAMLVESGRMYG